MRSNYIKPTHTNKSLQAKPTKPPFGYFGSKQRIACQILPMLPPHNAWVEGFCGSAALTLAKPPAPIEIINDADGQVVNLFQQLRDNADELCESIALTPYSREEFKAACSSEEKDITPLEKARLFLVTAMMTVNSTYGKPPGGFSFSNSYSRQKKEPRVNRWYNLPDRIEKVVERLRGIRIENRDACELMQMFIDRPASLVYLDPPYLMQRDFNYVVDANSLEFHEKLLTSCKKARCMLLISGYENDLYDQMLKAKDGWEQRQIKTHTRTTNGKNSARVETLWMNKYFVKAKAKGVVPIRLSRNEKQSSKVNPSRKR